MQNAIFTISIVFFISIISIENITAQDNKEFNAKLAKELKADDYGMKKYVIAFLKKGSNRSQDSITKAKLQRAHLDNITKMADEGILVLAGPFLDEGELRGIYIFNVETVEEAKKLTESDPLIQSGGLIMELHPWYGSAATQEIGKIHKTIQKKEI
ncbi:MAG: YciI family protein [Bacteroidota bacterium]